MQPHVEVIRGPGSASSPRGVFALRLTAVPTDRTDLDDGARADHAWRRILGNLIHALHVTQPVRTFAIRCSTRKSVDGQHASDLSLAWFSAIEAHSAKEAITTARTLCTTTLGLLTAIGPGHRWVPISDAEEFARLWRPFDLDTAHAAEIARRESWFDVHATRRRPSLGGGRASRTEPQTHCRLYAIRSFAPSPGDMTRLFRTMLGHPAPLVVQATIAPSHLTAAERRAMREELRNCTSAEMARAHDIHDPIAPPWLADVTTMREFTSHWAARITALEPAPFLTQLTVASPESMPHELLRSIAIQFSEEAPVPGRNESESGEHLTGGFDVLWPGSLRDRKIAAGNIANLRLDRWSHGKGPVGLERVRFLVDAREAASIFQFPRASAVGVPGLATLTARVVPAPPEVSALLGLPPDQRVTMGESPSFGGPAPACLAQDDRPQHCYVLGQTGTGKSTLLKSMILSDIAAGRGVGLIDPHGDLFHEILEHIPEHRREDVVLLDPTDADFPVGLNLLECEDPDARHHIAREMRAIMERLLADQFGSQSAEYTGPVFFQHMQMNLLLAMSDPGQPGTLLEFYQIFQSRDYWRRWLPLKWEDAMLNRWVNSTLEKIDYTKRSSDQQCTWGEYLSSKFEDFVFDPRLRLIFGQRRSTINLSRVMDCGMILLVNLAKGEFSESNSRFLGMVLMGKLQAAAMQRVRRPAANRRTFFLYVDEFQSIATQSFMLMLSEARKFGLALTLANQFYSQIGDERIMRSVSGNVGTTVCFRVGREDAVEMERLFLPHFDRLDLVNLPNWSACVKTNVGGQVAGAFSLKTVPPPHPPAPGVAEQIRHASRRLHARARADVEEEIRRGMEISRGGGAPEQHPPKTESAPVPPPKFALFEAEVLARRLRTGRDTSANASLIPKSVDPAPTMIGGGDAHANDH